MAITLVTNQTTIARSAGALYSVQVGTATMNALVTQANATGTDALLNSIYTQSVGSLATTAVAAELIKNLGITGTAAIQTATDYIVAQLNPVAVNARGAVVGNILNLFSGLSDATFGPAATVWNTKVASAVSYATVAGTTDAIFGIPSGPSEAKFVLTTGQDVLTGTDGADIFRAVAGQPLGAQDQTTLNSSDILDGAGSNADALIVNMTGPTYNGGARIKNIETLQIGTNQATALFDYNVNAGSNEVTEVTKIVADQITVGEVLTVNNILTTATTTTAASTTANVIPTLAWVNEAGATAGNFQTNFRDSAVADADPANGATNVFLELTNVKSGVYDLGTGANASVEVLHVKSLGTSANTLNNSNNADGSAIDLVSASTDGTNDNGALKTVFVEGTQAFGKAATVVTSSSNANYGLVNRVAAGAGDGGLDASSTASNLVSVAATVTTVDANKETGDLNLRFTSKVNGADVPVTLVGGAGNDYVEFQQGNISATGGDGNDAFAFVNGLSNSGFNTSDTIVGGKGDDTIQMGVNGVGLYDLSTTEFNSKSGIETLDMRGNTNRVAVADSFAGGVDAGKTLTIRTDKIVQTSDTDSANPAHTNAYLEDNTVSVINLASLSGNRAINFQGGAGSDRLVVNEGSLDGSKSLNGGTNAGNNGAAATTGDFDSITAISSSIAPMVLTSGDLANVSNFEGLNLVKSAFGVAATHSVVLTEAFLLANTASTDSVATANFDERSFVVSTAATTFGAALAAGDTVTVDVTDLLTSTGAIKSSLASRFIDTDNLALSGATVNYVSNGVIVASTTAEATANASLNTLVNGSNTNTTGIAQINGSVADLAATGVSLTGTGGTGGTGSSTVAVSAAGTTDASTSNITFNVAAGTYTYNIAGFGAGDKLAFPAGNAASVTNTSFTDGVVDLTWAQAGQTATIHLTGISNANDAQLNSVANFNTLFGAGTIA